MPRLVTFFGLITAIAFAVAPELVSINSNVARYAMLIGVAAAAAGRELDPRKLRRGFPPRGSFASRKTLKAVAVAVLSAGLLLGSSACSTPSLGQTARVIEVGAQELQREIKSLVESGDITPDEAARAAQIADAVEGSAHVLGLSAVNFKSLKPEDRRALVLQFIGELEEQAGKLDGLAFKSEKARRVLSSARRNVRLGLSALRVVEAAIPQKGD